MDSGHIYIVPSMLSNKRGGQDRVILADGPFKRDIIDRLRQPAALETIGTSQHARMRNIADVSDNLAGDYASTYAIAKTLLKEDNVDIYSRKSVIIEWQKNRREAGKIWAQIMTFQGLVEQGKSPEQAFAASKEPQGGRMGTPQTSRNVAFNHTAVSASDAGKRLLQEHGDAKFKRDILAHMMGFKMNYYCAALTKHPLLVFDLAADMRVARNTTNKKDIMTERQNLMNSIPKEMRMMPKQSVSSDGHETMIELKLNNKGYRGRLIDYTEHTEKLCTLTVNTQNSSQTIALRGERNVKVLKTMQEGEALTLILKQEEGQLLATHAYKFALGRERTATVPEGR